MSQSISGKLNEFIKGAAWGFVAFVHVALFTVLTYKFALNCLPARFVTLLACTPPDSAKCAAACDSTGDVYFYVLAVITSGAFVLLPLGLGIFFATKPSPSTT